MPEDRILTALMFTNIVRDTALMGSDESEAFQLPHKNHDLQRPLIKKYRREWLKEMGDKIESEIGERKENSRVDIYIDFNRKTFEP